MTCIEIISSSMTLFCFKFHITVLAVDGLMLVGNLIALPLGIFFAICSIWSFTFVSL